MAPSAGELWSLQEGSYPYLWGQAGGYCSSRSPHHHLHLASAEDVCSDCKPLPKGNAWPLPVLRRNHQGIPLSLEAWGGLSVPPARAAFSCSSDRKRNERNSKFPAP